MPDRDDDDRGSVSVDGGPLRVRVLDGLAGIEPAAWDALHDGRNPFVCHAFLAGLEWHGCLRPDWGWAPMHVTLWDDDHLVAAAPGYLKGNSHGEFVFDHAWAQAYRQHGLDYFPKWLGAVPYSPVSGPRLLARDPALRQPLLAAIVDVATRAGLSSAHVNFHEAGEDAAFQAAGTCANEWLQRIDVQYHWRNDRDWGGFGDFLAAMDHKHRKNIRQERSRVARAGVRFRVLHGDEATPADLAVMHALYRQTFAEYGNAPALTLEFLAHLASAMPRQLVLILAERAPDAAEPAVVVAGALCLRGGDTLYGRYWGAFETIPGLHFETCYYQGIDYCLREDLHRFEPGAQGEHKLARGFLPALVRSHHWLAEPAFAEALRPWCAEEARSLLRHRDSLAAHDPFRRPAG